MADDDSVELLKRWRTGDERAAEELFLRYTGELLALARRQLSPKLARRVDPEDVVQSAYRSFFAAARADRYVLERSGDLWRLLSAITLHKALGQVERQTAAKRAPARERGFGTESSLFGLHPEDLARTPSPSETVAVVDELESVLRDFSPRNRQMVELRLQGYTLDEIATATERSERMVRRVLEQVKERLEERCRAAAAG